MPSNDMLRVRHLGDANLIGPTGPHLAPYILLTATAWVEDDTPVEYEDIPLDLEVYVGGDNLTLGEIKDLLDVYLLAVQDAIDLHGPAARPTLSAE